MEIKVLNKYSKSRLNGVLIRQLNVHSTGKVVIVAENNETKDFYIDVECIDYSADSIICNFQDDESINVSKY